MIRNTVMSEKRLISNESLLSSFHFRHACKLFDAEKKIPKEDADMLLEAARLSPTSFGMQGWKIYLITDPETKKKLKPHCWNQAQIDTCSHLMVFTTRTKDLLPGSPWVQSRFLDRGMPEDKLTGYYDRYSGFHTDREGRIERTIKGGIINFFYSLFHKNQKGNDIYHWAARQCYIALGTVMTAAALIGIDSCPVEGFSKNAVDRFLNLNTEEEEAVFILTLGYRAGEGSSKKRLPLNELVQEFRIS